MQPWLGPDVCDHLRALRDEGVTNVVVAPIGFVSDHMEVVYDLDIEARRVADELGMKMVRARTAGTHPVFVKMIRELILERINDEVPANICAPDCCQLS
jgi:ferrochelatase